MNRSPEGAISAAVKINVQSSQRKKKSLKSWQNLSCIFVKTEQNMAKMKGKY